MCSLVQFVVIWGFYTKILKAHLGIIHKNIVVIFLHSFQNNDYYLLRNDIQ